MFDDLETIYIVFQSFVTNREKVEYLEKLRDRNLDYDINYDKLIEIYSK